MAASHAFPVTDSSAPVDHIVLLQLSTNVTESQLQTLRAGLEVRLDEERSGKLAMPPQVAKTTLAHTSV